MRFHHIQVQPLSGHVGAEIDGIDLSKPLEDRVFKEIHRAFLDHAVLAFRGQSLSHEHQIAFARRFGDLDIHPIPARHGEPEHLHLDARFLVHAPPNAREKLSHESVELGWFGPDEVEGIASDESLLRLFRLAFER